MTDQGDLGSHAHDDEAGRPRLVRLMQERLRARKRSTKLQNATAQTIKSMTRFMVAGVVVAALCTTVTIIALALGIFLKS